jgi:hypothetical protein
VRARHRLSVIRRRELVSVTPAGRGGGPRHQPVGELRDPPGARRETVVEARVLLANRRWM